MIANGNMLVIVYRFALPSARARIVMQFWLLTHKRAQGRCAYLLYLQIAGNEVFVIVLLCIIIIFYFPAG